jgi:hypothetical protein
MNSTGSLTDIQRAYNLIREQHDEANAEYERWRQVPDRRLNAEFAFGLRAGLREALEILTTIDPDCDPGESVPSRIYGSEVQ